jgi:hypothetical protein
MSSERPAAAAPSKKPYARPQLTAHGRLVELTTGGTGSAKETSPGQSSKRPTG